MIPNSRIPFIYVDFDNSKAISPGATQAYNVLLIGQKLDGSPGASGVATYIRSEKDVSDQFGAGSMLHLMAKAYFANSPTAKTYALALDDPKGAIAAQWAVSLEGQFLNPGTLPFFIAGRKLEVLVTKDSTAQGIFKDLADAITKDPSLPVKVNAVAADSVTLTAKNRGFTAGQIDVRTEFGMVRQSVTGFKLKVPPEHIQSGAGPVDLYTSVIKNISDKQFHVIVSPYTDNDVEKDCLTVMKQDLEDRFSASRGLDGHMIASTAGDDSVFSDPSKVSTHSEHLTILCCGKSSPTPPFVWAAAVGAVVANEGQIDPARPFNTLPLNGCIAPEPDQRLSRRSRQALLSAGLSTYTVNFSGVPCIERLITTYYNENAPADESYLSLNTLLTLSYLRFSFVNYFAAKYPRHKLADDGAIVKPGSAILTPKTAQCEAVALFLSWEEDGLVENFEEFKNDLYVERNVKDRGRLDFYMSPRLISQLNVIGAKVSFLI